MTNATETLGRLGVWTSVDSFPAAEAADFAQSLESLGYGALWIPEAIGRDPFSVLGYLGAVAVLLGGVLELDPRLMAGLGLVANLAGQGGDLVEAYFKRAMGAKDSATTFGEMGGILDMLDALLLAAPAAYTWCQLLVVREMPL